MSITIIRDYQFLDDADKGAAVAIGNFDGVHLGHQAVLDITRKEATRLDCPLGVLTFEPHPRSYFAPDAPTFRLMNADSKAHQLEKLGVTHLYQLNFNAALSGLTALEFGRDVIANGLGLRHLVVGADFCFGKGRLGNAQMLSDLGKEFGFGVTIVPLLTEQDKVISSTEIRKALADGRPDAAAAMLGHWHRIEASVEHGDARGRDLGFPTANLPLDGLHLPKFGVYAVIADILDGAHAGRYMGAASLGERPTFGVNVPNLEVFLFDFSGDIYGAQMSVALVDFQRGEEKYDSLDDLITQMHKDCDQARETLQKHI